MTCAFDIFRYSRFNMASLALAMLIALACCTCAVRSVNDRLREVFSWRQVDFMFPDQQTRQAAIASGEYVQANNMPLGLEVWRDKLFITVPRWKAGVASTLNYVSLGSGKLYHTDTQTSRNQYNRDDSA